MRQVGSCFQEVYALCQLLETGWLLLARGVRTMSVTRGRLTLYIMVFSDNHLWQIGVCCALSQLVEAWWQLSLSYMRQVGDYLLDIWDRIAVFCQLHEAGYRFSAGNVCTLYLEAGWRLSVSYMRHVGSCLQGVCVLCQLLETDWWLSVGCVYTVCYLRQQGVYLSATRGRLVVVYRGV
jgi:hypothetical protein